MKKEEEEVVQEEEGGGTGEREGGREENGSGRQLPHTTNLSPGNHQPGYAESLQPLVRDLTGEQLPEENAVREHITGCG